MTRRHPDGAAEDGLPPLRILWQPIVRLGTPPDGNEVVGYEALGRIEGAANTGLVLAQHDGTNMIWDRALREQALATAAILPPGRKLFINITSLAIQAAMALRHPLPQLPGVVWELSESWNWRAETAEQARWLFGEYALDDVGTGYADLERFRRLRPPWVKIARAVVSGCDRDAGKRAVIRTIAWLARRFRSRTVAEGVETEGEARALIRLGVQYAQGYLFGRPDEPAAWTDLTARPDPDTGHAADNRGPGSPDPP